MATKFNWLGKSVGDAAGLAVFLQEYKPADWCKNLIIHNTVEPDEGDWAGKKSMTGMGNFYRDTQKWNGGPHFVAAPDGIWIGSEPNVMTVHSNICNDHAIAMEVVGFYDKRVWQNPIRAYAISGIAVILQWLGLGPEALLGHRDCGSPKTCPGASIDMNWVRHLTSLQMGLGPRWMQVMGDGTNVRTAPDRRTGRVVKQFHVGQVVPVGALTIGDNVSGNPRWLWNADGTGFWHTSLARDVKPVSNPAFSEDDALICTPRAPLAHVTEKVLAGWKHPGYTDEQIAELIGLYYEIAAPVGLDPVFAIAQMLHETGGFGASDWSSPKYMNPAGLGVTGNVFDTKPAAGDVVKKADGKWHEGLTFKTLREAVECHVGRLLRYALPADTEVPAQVPIMEAALKRRALGRGYWGKATILKGLGGTWAFPGNGYGTKLADVATKLVS